MPEYLVTIDIDTGDLDPAEVTRLRQAEGVQATRLAEEGRIVALWRVPGRWANVGLWRAPSRSTLDQALATLPLRPYMSVVVQELGEHPSDPRSIGGQVANRPVGDELVPLPDLALRTRATTGEVTGRGRIELPSLSDLAIRGRGRVEAAATRSQPSQPVAGFSWVTREIDVTACVARVEPDTADEHAHVRVGEALAAKSANGVPLHVTHSGRHGLDSAIDPNAVQGITVDIGRLRRIAAVRPLPGGGEALQIRNVVTLTAVGAEGLDFEDVGALLRTVEDELTGS
ncbi:muconolactone Delta-isomerase family protein [Cnuibacter sp. UC19_7]|uniref:muconolactone Delta-isomerase family protein n=1 Tax=Cnuibacter sp. UC19_7 TaxID=3350166 RepID=UPI00366FC28C